MSIMAKLDQNPQLPKSFGRGVLIQKLMAGAFTSLCSSRRSCKYNFMEGYPPFENLDRLENRCLLGKQHKCRVKNLSDFLTKKWASKYSHDMRVFFISVKKTITNIKQSWWSIVYKKNFCSEMDSRVDLQPFFFSSNQSILSASGSQAKVNGAWDGPECFVNDNVIHNQKKSLAWMWFSLFVTSIMAFFIGRLVNVL